MSNSIVRQINKIDDSMLYQACKDVMAVLEGDGISCKFYLTPTVAEDIAEIKNIDELVGRYAYERAVVQGSAGGVASVNWDFQRMVRSVDGRVLPSAIYDQVECTYLRDNRDWENKKDKIKRLNQIIAELGLPRPQGEVGEQEGVLRDLLVGFGATHRNTLASLSEAIKKNEERRAEIDELAAQKEQERAEAHRVAIDEREEATKKVLEELEAERAKLELQSYKSERRKILKQMTNTDIAQIRRTLTPPEVHRAHWFIAAVGLVVSAIAAYFAVLSISQLGLNQQAVSALSEQIAKITGNTDTISIKLSLEQIVQPNIWFLMAKSTISSIIAIGGLLFSANWIRSFYNSEVEKIREIDSFNYDLNRAGWILETILEAQTEHDAEIPKEWIQGATRGLFKRTSEREGLDDPTQALKALMGFTASASFGPDGPKFDIGKKDAKKLAKAE